MASQGSRKVVFMYFIGVDIAKFTHVASVIDQNGEIVVHPFPFSNSIEGFQIFLNKICSFPSDEIAIGFESTGHYHQNFAHFISKNHYMYFLINPLLTKRYRGLNLRNVKNDRIDSLSIASFISFNFFQLKQENFHIDDILFLSKERHQLIQKRSSEKIRLMAYLDRVFPELSQNYSSKIHTKAFYALLLEIPSAHQIKNTRVDKILNLLNRNRHSFSREFAQNLKELAKNSVGYTNNSIHTIIKSIMHQIKCLNAQIKMIETEILNNEIVRTSPLLQLKGMGYIQIANLLSAIKNISHFSSPEKLVAFAGLDPIIRQSGTFNAKSTRMSKRGNKLLRYTLIWAANNLRKNSTTMKRYYDKKRSENKSHYNALGHCAKKLISYIFYILNHPQEQFLLD